MTAKRQRSPHRFVEAHSDTAAADVFGIGELATEFDTTPRAIRFYESKGLLTPRRIGSTRVYGRRERARLQLILRGKSLGLSLREIKQYLDLYGEHGEGRKKQLTLVIERCSDMIDELTARRAQIDTTLQELRHIKRVSVRRLKAL